MTEQKQVPLLQKIGRFLFPILIAEERSAALASVSVRVDDSRGWDDLTPGPADRNWSERKSDLDDALEAWQKNFLVRRIVTLVRSYVVGNGVSISSKVPEVDEFVKAFWTHPKNHFDTRLGPMCDELTRAGELFPILHTNKVDGMSYVRFIPASSIQQIKTAENDYELELEYGELTNSAEPTWWIGKDHHLAFKTYYGKLKPLMLHYSVNKVIGGTRGEGDLGPVLPWARRYSEWLKDRVRLNRQRTRQGVLDILIEEDSLVEEKRQQLRTRNPVEHGIYVHGPGEEVKFHALNIQARDAGEDGKLLRLAIASGANTALHYLGEGGEVNYATAKEMGEPTARFHSERQDDFCAMLLDLTETAYRRRHAILPQQAPLPSDFELSAAVTEVARADNLALAQAARNITAALEVMKKFGWIDDATATRLALKFAGEALDDEEITSILDKSSPDQPNNSNSHDNGGQQ